VDAIVLWIQLNFYLNADRPVAKSTNLERKKCVLFS
jgi:hypothetical protein